MLDYFMNTPPPTWLLWFGLAPNVLVLILPGMRWWERSIGGVGFMFAAIGLLARLA